MIHSEPAKPNRNILITVLVVALIVSVLMLLVSFTGIAPDLPTKIGMGSIAFIVGFFGVQGWISRTGLGLTLCIIFGTAEVFTHISFVLISTNIQAKSAKIAETKIEDDPEYKRLVKRADDIQGTANSLALKVAGTSEGFKSEVDIRQGGVKEQNITAKEASDDVKDYVKQFRMAVTNGAADHGGSVRIDADQFFTAIPDAVTSGIPARWIEFFFAAFIFSGIQITVLVAADLMILLAEQKREAKNLAEQEEKTAELLAEEAKKPRTGRAPGVVRSIPKKVVYGWVEALWHDAKVGTSDKIINRAQAARFLTEKGIPITKLHDEKLYNLALKLGIIAEDGTIKKTAIEAKKLLDDAQKRKE